MDLEKAARNITEATFTTTEAAKRLGVYPKHVANLCNEGKIDHVRVQGRILPLQESVRKRARKMRVGVPPKKTK